MKNYEMALKARRRHRKETTVSVLKAMEAVILPQKENILYVLTCTLVRVVY